MNLDYAVIGEYKWQCAEMGSEDAVFARAERIRQRHKNSFSRHISYQIKFQRIREKGKMKNRKLARKSIAAGVLAASVFMLSGFDSAMTAPDVIDQGTKATAEKNFCTVNVTVDLDAGLQIGSDPDTAAMVPVTGSMAMAVAYQKDPAALQVTGNITGTVMGQDLSGDVMEYIVKNEDGTGTSYVRVTTQDTSASGADSSDAASTQSSGGSDSGWQSTTVGADSMKLIEDSLNDASGSDYSALMDTVKESAVLATAAATLNGQECYEVSYTVNGSDLKATVDGLLDKSTSLSSLDATAREGLDTLLGCLKAEIVTDYDTASLLPVHTTADFSGSDMTAVNDLLKSLDETSASSDTEDLSYSEDYTMSAVLNTLKVEADYDFDTAVSISVPDDVKNSAVQTDVNDITGGLSDLSSETGTAAQ